MEMQGVAVKARKGGEKVTTGRSGSASEVIRESVRLLEQEDLKKRLSLATRADLAAKLMEGVATTTTAFGTKGAMPPRWGSIRARDARL